MEDYKRVEITEEAAQVVQQLKEQHGELIFHQSGGCCDGSSPMLLQKEDFYLDDNDILLGEVSGVPFYMSHDQFEYWKHTFLTVDITTGRGSSFSLEIPLGKRFLIKSRMLTEEEAEFLNRG
jgi:uncharacterized protein (DUF779 family)